MNQTMQLPRPPSKVRSLSSCTHQREPQPGRVCARRRRLHFAIVGRTTAQKVVSFFFSVCCSLTTGSWNAFTKALPPAAAAAAATPEESVAGCGVAERKNNYNIHRNKLEHKKDAVFQFCSRPPTRHHIVCPSTLRRMRPNRPTNIRKLAFL